MKKSIQSRCLSILPLSLIVFFALLVAAGLRNFLTQQVDVPLKSLFYEALFGVVIFLIFFVAYHRYLWRIKFFGWRVFGGHPDLSGRWVGFLNSSYQRDGQNMIVPVTLEIKQTASTVFVRACFEKAMSDSLIADFEIIHRRAHLCYMYDNTLATKKQGKASHDRGCVVLEYLEHKGERILKGKYFNDLKPVPNYGDIKVVYSDSKLLNQ